MIFQKHGYVCNGNISEWAQCGHFEEKPLRMKCKIPSEMKKDGDFFSKYSSKVEDRALRPAVINAVKKLNQSGSEIREAKTTRQREPLYNMHLVLIGSALTAKRNDLKLKIERMGGKLTTKIHSKIAVIISTPDEVEKMNQRMEEAKSHDIQVVTEDFLTSIDKGSPKETVEKIKSMSICTWGGDPTTRIPQEEMKTEKVSFVQQFEH